MYFSTVYSRPFDGRGRFSGRYIALSCPPRAFSLECRICVGMVFGLVHANWAQAVPALVAGFVFGILYIRADDIRLCGVAHVLNNTLAMLLLFFPAAESYMVAMNLALQLIVGAFLFIGGGVLVYCSGISVRGEKILLFPEK